METHVVAFILFQQGKSFQESGKFNESLRKYAKAIQISDNVEDISLALDELKNRRVQSVDYEITRKLLLIGLAVKFRSTKPGKIAYKTIKKIASRGHDSLQAPIVIVAGGCKSDVEAKIRTYKDHVLSMFDNFHGTIISGGTMCGISELVGEVQEKYQRNIRTIGYVPKAKKNLIDNHYSEIRFTQTKTFSPLEPIQYWIDIIASDILSSEVKLLGINGGRISAFEYRLALALGASVYILKDSGMEADNLLINNNWKASRNLSIITDTSIIRF
jgi:hypothetical protein